MVFKMCEGILCSSLIKELDVIVHKQDKSEGFDTCDRPSNPTQTGFKSSIFQPVWPWNLIDDPEKQ